MATIEYQTQINAPPAEVFAYLSDLEKHPEWSHCDEISKTSEGQVGVGATYASRGKNLGITAKETVEVKEFSPNERFAWQSTGAMGLKFGWSFEMRPEGGGTLLIERHEPPGGLAGSLINMVASGSTRKAIQEGLGRIKERLEAGRGATAEASAEGSQEQSPEGSAEVGQEVGQDEGQEQPS